MPRRTVHTMADFWSYIGESVEVDPETGCWIWGRTLNNYGYALVSGRWLTQFGYKRTALAHRVSWEIFRGEKVPDGLELDHFACQRRNCVAPHHCEPVTHLVNVRRSVSARKAERAAELLADVWGGLAAAS